MAQQQWFVVRGDVEDGPFSGTALKDMAASGKLKPTDQVRRADVESARPASQIKGLFPATGSAVVPSNPAKPADQPPQSTNKKKWMLIGSVVAAVLFMSCAGLIVGGFLIANSERQAAKQDYAEAEALWSSGRRDEAAAKYRSALKGLRGEERAIAYGRLIDHEYESGNSDAGKALFDEAAQKNVVPVVSHESAKAQLAWARDAKAQAVVMQDPARFNFTLAQQVASIAANDHGLTKDEAEVVLHPGKQLGGLVYEEDDKEFDPKAGKFVTSKMKKGTIKKGGEAVKKLVVGPLSTDRGDPKVDNNQPRIHSIEAVVRDGNDYHTKTRWDFLSLGGSGEPVRLWRHPHSVTEYDGTRWKRQEKLTSFYVTGQKAYECYGRSSAGHIDPCCFDKRNRYWDQTGKDIDQNTYCEAGLGKNWRENFFKSEARAGRQNVEQLLESMKRNGVMSDDEAKKVIRDLEQSGSIPRK